MKDMITDRFVWALEKGKKRLAHDIYFQYPTLQWRFDLIMACITAREELERRDREKTPSRMHQTSFAFAGV